MQLTLELAPCQRTRHIQAFVVTTYRFSQVRFNFVLRYVFLRLRYTSFMRVVQL